MARPQPPFGADDEARLVEESWTRYQGHVPRHVRDLVEAGRYLDAAIELARQVIGEPPLIGWRMAFTSAGGPYEVQLLFDRPRLEANATGASEQALSAAFLDAISKAQGHRGS
ncbi:MAG: hypothetical protein AB7L41_08750 [Flavobacteriaceae bacterium]